MTVTINREYTERFYKKLESFNKKYGKYATPVKILSVEEHAEKSREFGTQFFLDIELDVPTAKFGKSNVTYLGVIVMEDDTPMIHTEQEGYDLNSLYKPNYCDHCHTTRRRNKYFFFLENGEVKQIGSSCVTEYFGANIGSAFISFNKFVSDVEEENERRVGFSGACYVSFDEIVTATFRVTNGFAEWVKKGNEYATDSVSLVKNYLTQDNAREYFRKDDYTMSDDEKEEFRQYVIDSFGNRFSDYCNNVRSSLLMGEDKLRMGIPFRFVGIVASVIFGFEKARKIASEPVDSIPTDVKEGEEVEFTALISFIKSGYGRFGEWYMYKVLNTPYRFFLKDSIDEGRYELKGVVKEVSSYNGKPSIMLNNVNCSKGA